MRSYTTTFSAAVMLTALIATTLLGQTQAKQPDPMVATIQMAATHIRGVFTIAAEQMSDADYAFKPTPEVRSFGQLLGHVADTNYWFCSSASGEKSPASDIEKTKVARADIQKALGESFDYCDRVFASMNDETNAKAMRTFMKQQLPALALLNFRNYHSLLHWGNSITYMRLRGKVPPSA